MKNIYFCKHETTDLVLFSQMHKPKSFFKRNNGLMFKNELNPEQALMITGCNFIHTFFMKFNIDVIYLNKNLEIKKIKTNVKPYRLTMPVLGARSVIECTAGNSKLKKLKIGEKLIVYS